MRAVAAVLRAQPSIVFPTAVVEDVLLLAVRKEREISFSVLLMAEDDDAAPWTARKLLSEALDFVQLTAVACVVSSMAA